jgi:hypothetical protein
MHKNIIILLFTVLFLASIPEAFAQDLTGAGDDHLSGKDSAEVITESMDMAPETEDPVAEDEGFGPEEMYLNFNYGGVISTLLTCYYDGDKTYIPIEDFLNILQITNSFNGDVISGYFMYSANDFEIDLSSAEITYKGNTTSFAKNDVLEVGGKYFIEPSAMANGFDMDIVVDLGEMSLGLFTENTPPVMVKMERELLRDAILSGEKKKEAPLLFKRSKNWLRGEFLDYFLSSSYTEGVTPFYSYSLTSGNELLGGDLYLNFSGSHNGDINNYDFDGNWRYVFGDNKILNQVLVGTKLQSKGIDPHSFKGISLTNAPFDVDENFGSYVLIDNTIPNSDVELYINNQLIAYTKADDNGNYKFNIPLTYGSNTVELKIYSPDGQLIENNRRIQVPFDYLPENDFQYYVNFGERSDTKDLVYHGSLAYGITSWLTNRAGVDFTSTESFFTNPVFFNSLSARITDNYLFNYTLAPELYHRLQVNAQFFDLQSVGLKYTKYKQNKLYNVRNIEEDVELTAGLPFDIFDTRMGLQVQGLYEKLPDTKIYKMDIGSNFTLLNFSPSVNFAYWEEQSPFSKSVRKEVRFGLSSPVPFLNGFFPELMSGKYLNTSLRYDAVSNKFANAKVTYSSNLTNNARLEFNYNKDFQNDFSSFNVVFRYEFPFAVTNTIADDRSVMFNIHGTLGYDNVNENIFTTKRQSVGTGGVAFRMYQDENGNGKFDDGEKIVDDVDLKFTNNVSMERNDEGILMASELSPYHKYEVEINPLSGKDPFLQPKFQRFSLETDPNQIKLVEIPFYFSQEVYGSVVALKNGAEIPLPGVKIHIKGEELEEEKIITSFNDGSIYFLGLLPGKYTAYVSPSMVEKLGATSDPTSIDFELSEDMFDDSGLKDLNFVLNLDNSNISEIDPEQLASFRAKFIHTEKMINSRTGTPDAVRKEFFDEITASEFRALPEFADLYDAMDAKLKQWQEDLEKAPESTSTGYTVVKGDCLWKIAGMKQHYDNPHLWPAIWEANKDGVISAPPGVKTVITNPNLIYPGQVLKIPSLSEEEKQEFLNIEGEYYDKKGRGKPRNK